MVFRPGFLLIVCILAACSSRGEQTADVPGANFTAAGAPAPSSKVEAMKKLGVAEPYQGELFSLSLLNVRDAKMEQVLPAIEYPWALEFTSPREILLTRHAGLLQRINLDTGEAVTIEGLPAIGSGSDQIGLMDIALHPDFDDNRRLYLSYARENTEVPGYFMTEVATATLQNDALVDLQLLINPEEYGWAPSNFGGALAFDDQGYLYVAIGDRGNEPLAQSPDRLESKILRLHDDGGVPQDNPFVGQQGYDPRIYAVGVRNVQGLFFDRSTGQLFSVEHGPLGGDEINVITAGSNYGWAKSSYGSNYVTIQPVGEGTHLEGVEQPLFYFLPSLATTKILRYRGEMFPTWKGDLIVANLKARSLVKVDLDGDHVRSSREFLQELEDRIRDIKQGPDGSLYVLTQTKGLFRLYREPDTEIETAPETSRKEKIREAARSVIALPRQREGVHPGKTYYELVCAGCHDSGALGAPKVGDFDQWRDIVKQPPEVTLERVANGYKAMPPMGMCYACTEYSLMEIVDYMMESSSPPGTLEALSR